MPNAKDFTVGNGSIMAVGDSGTKKTRFIAGLPKAYVFDFDAGMASLKGCDIDYDTFKDAKEGRPVPPEESKKSGIYTFGDGWLRFNDKLQSLGDQARAGTLKYNFLCFDSLSFLTLMSRNRALIEQGAKKPHQGVYGDENHFISVVFNEIVTWPNIRIYATAHVQRDTNDVTKITEKLPALTGKLAARLPSYFDEVYYIDFAGDGTSRRFHVLSEPANDMRSARTRWQVPNRTEFVWDDGKGGGLKKYLQYAGAPLK